MAIFPIDKNIKVDLVTYRALTLLRDERGSYCDVIKDMLSEFAPFLYQMTIGMEDCVVEPKGLEGAKIQRYNELLGAKQAYTDFKKRQLDAMERENYHGCGFAEIRDRVDAEFDGKTEDDFDETN